MRVSKKSSRIMCFPNLFVFWGVIIIQFTLMLCKPLQSNDVYPHDMSVKQSQSLPNTVLGARSVTRPPLADDAYSIDNVYAKLNVINASKLFVISTKEINGPIKTNVIKKYLDCLHKEVELEEKKQEVGKSYDARQKGSKVLDRIWHMYTKGTLGKAQENKLSLSQFENKWPLIKREVLPGSFLELGGCEMALAAGRRTKSVTAIALDLKHEHDESVESSCSNTENHNVYMATSTPAQMQAYFREVYADYKVLLNNVYLTDFTVLSKKLLPHEYVQMLAVIFSMSKKILIRNINLSKSQELYFKEQWGTPGSLFNQACSQASLDCGVDVLWGYDAWSNDDVVYSITVRFGRRNLSRNVCLKLSSIPKCYASYNETSPNMTVVFDNGKQLISPVHANEIHLKTLVKLGEVIVFRFPSRQTHHCHFILPFLLIVFHDLKGLKEECRDMLFVRLLQLPFQGQDGDNLFVKGSNIVRRKLVDISEHQDIRQRQHTQNSQRDTVHPNLPPVLIKSKERDTSKSVVHDAASLHHVDRSWVRKGRGSRRESQQFGGGWDRENPDSINHQGELHEEMQTLERETDSVDSETVIIKDSFERKELSDEEKQIHRGLDFLQSQTSYHDMNENNITLKTVLKPEFNNPSSSKLNQGKIGDPMNNAIVLESYPTATKHHKETSVHMFRNVPSKQKGTSSSKLPSNSTIRLEPLNFSARSRSSPGLEVNKLPHPEVQRQTSNTLSLKMSSPVKKLKTFFPHDSDKLLKALLAKRHRYKINERKTSVPSSNMRKLFSYPLSSNESQTDMYSYIHYTRRRHQHPSDSKIVSEKEPVNDLFVSMVTEELVFDGQWQAMKPFIMDAGDLDSQFNIFVYGQKRQSLLGNKVAMLYPESSVIMVFPQSCAGLVGDHRKLAKTLPHQNMVFSSDLSILLVNHLFSMPELFKFQVLSLDILRPMLSLGDMYPYYLGQVLAMAETTFLEIPHFNQLMLARTVFSDDDHVESTQGLIMDALSLVGAEAEVIEPLKVMIREEIHSVILRIKLKSVQRKVKVGCDNTPATLTLLPDGAVSLHIESANTYHTVSRTKVGVGLNLLLRMGLLSQDRAFLFQEYLKVPVHRVMCPSNIVWVEHRLKYQPITEEAEPPAPHTLGGTKDLESSQRTLELIGQEIEDESFSFMDYNSKDNIGFELSARYPNSTFVSLLANSDNVRPLLHDMEEKNITNIVLNVVKIDAKLLTKLLKCPDFLRYQFLDYDEILRQMKLQERDAFDLLIGQVIATGVTSFIQVPSSKILSLAAATFYPEDLGQTARHGIPKNYSYLFQAENHPLYPFRDAEDKFLFESARADVDIEIAAKVLSPGLLPNGAQLPWKLVRVDVKKLKVQVDHHFDYARDGHARKYSLHCVSNHTHNYDVYLIRSTDGFKIPYGNVNAISLIALLRMGLEKSIRDKFYDQFLKLPLYEDMAPWNIVFRAGHLDYIDYDSKDVTFNKMAAAAYQIMAMLMNYKRTVQDFDRCKSRAKTAYGFDSVAECVASDYTGPCTDTHYPVPCGDRTCKATYIDCLQALQNMELGKSMPVATDRGEVKTGVENSGYMQWSFNMDGASKENYR